MKTAELKELNEDELVQKLNGFKKELLDLRMEKAGGKLSKPHRIRQARRDSARILTLLNQRKGRKPS